MLDAFLRDYVRSHIHIVTILPDNSAPHLAPRGRWFGEDWQAATDWATAENAEGRNAYWTLNLVTPGLNKKPTKQDIVGIRGFGVDIDPPKDVTAWDTNATLQDLVQRGQPSYVISTGRGLQGVWLSPDTAVEHETVETVNRGLSAAFRGDSTHNVDRLFRLPGLINHGDAKKRAAGYTPAQACLITPFTGSIHNASDLASRFPAPAAVVTDVTALPQGPRPEWTLGDKTDDEILAMALRSRGGMAAMFGDKATFEQLWSGDQAVIEKFFPGPSEADMALAASLAFWWGGDAKAIDRMFRRSGLMRDKWIERGGYYANITIGKVLSTLSNVYSRPYNTEPQQLPGVTTDTALDGEVIPPGEVMMLHEQQQYFKGCVYVADLGEVLTPSGVFMKPATFKSMYGGFTFEIGTDSFEKNAYLAFTENRLHSYPKVITTMFEPELPFGEIDPIRSAVNVYRPDPNVSAVEGDVTPFLLHLSRMIPDERDRRILLTWMAAVVQYPGQKFQWAPFVQGTEGNGKSMIGQILKRAVGPQYVHEPFSDDLANKFNDWQENKILIIVEELALGEKADTMNNLKTWVTQKHIEMQAKGGKKMMRPNKANWIIFSNFQNGLIFTANDRRYCVFFTAQQSREDMVRDGMVDDYFPRLWNWLNNDDGYEKMTWFLRNYELDAEFSPVGTGHGAARAPSTSSTGAAITASMGRLEMEIIEAVESGKVGFRGGWISSNAINQLEKDLRLRMNGIKRKAALESLGYVLWGRSTTVVMAEGGTKPTLYCKAGMEGMTVAEFERAQGYILG